MTAWKDRVSSGGEREHEKVRVREGGNERGFAKLLEICKLETTGSVNLICSDALSISLSLFACHHILDV